MGNWRDLLDRSPDFIGAKEDYEGAKGVLFGIPMDFTVSFRTGTRLGPRRIREASYGIEEFSFYQKTDLGSKAYCDLGDIAVSFGDVERTLAMAKQVTEGILADGKMPFMLGGEHLVSLPVIQAVADKYPDLVVLHFDAHADLREDYLGQRHSHATVMRRVCEKIGPKNVYQFGIRSGTREEYEYARANTNFFPGHVVPALDEVIPRIGKRPVHITLDIDVIDPAFAPGTGTPEPGGVDSREMLKALHRMGALNVVGFDLVEVSPPYDPTERTVVLGAWLLREALLAFL